MDAIKSIEYKGYTIEVYIDDDPLNPRTEFDNMGTMVCWHRRYNLGDDGRGAKNPYPTREYDPEDWFKANLDYPEEKLEDLDLAELQALFEKTNLLIPIMAYEHGGITIRAYDYGNWPDQNWDCGQLGFIYASHETIRKEYVVKRLSKKTLEKARTCLLSEIEEYDTYLTGNIYGYVITDPEGEEKDSCWGFYGDYDKYMIPECKSIIDYYLEHGEA